jgi:hypothetical protein
VPILATLAAVAALVPAPPVVNYAYGPVDPNLNEQSNAPVSGYADTSTNTVYLPVEHSAFMKAHEVGHLFDTQILSDGDRRFFQRTMGMPAGPWDHGAAYGTADLGQSPSEWFADYYGAIAAGFTRPGWNVGSFAVITPKRAKKVHQALKRVARRHNLKPLKM